MIQKKSCDKIKISETRNWLVKIDIFEKITSNTFDFQWVIENNPRLWYLRLTETIYKNKFQRKWEKCAFVQKRSEIEKWIRWPYTLEFENLQIEYQEFEIVE